MKTDDKSRLAKKLFVKELIDYKTYLRLENAEKDRGIKILLGRIRRMEKAHLDLWAEIASIGNPGSYSMPMQSFFTINFYLFLRKVLGIPFLTMLLTKNEKVALDRYAKALKQMNLTPRERAQINAVISDEIYNEKDLKNRVRDYQGQINHIKSIVFGLNDGLVELLGAVSGIAVIANSSIVVVISGIIIGCAGTLSMAAGSYLSTKSHSLLEEGTSREDKEHEDSTPGQAALYTGFYYFLGAIVSIIPFIFGLKGALGIVAAIILGSLALSFASVVIAVVSGTSVKKRVLEMLVISLGVVAITVILGYMAKTYFGVTI